MLQSCCILLLLLGFNGWKLAHAYPRIANHLILVFQFLDLPLELPDLNVLKLQLTLNVIHLFLFGASEAHFHVLLRSLRGIVIPSASKHAYEAELLSEFMNILAEDVDLLEKHDILLHNPGVLLLVHILIFLKHLP